MSKESWFVGLGQEEVAWVWGKCLKYLKSGWNRKGRRRNRFLKRAGLKLDLGLGSLGKGGLYVVHASCFSSLQGGRYSGLLGRGENLIWGGGGFAACCLQNTLLLAKIDSILISENLINILINAENTKKDFLPFYWMAKTQKRTQFLKKCGFTIW